MSQLAELGNLWHSIQTWLFPMLEDEFDEKHREFEPFSINKSAW